MNYFNDEKNVNDYIEMVKDYDGTFLVDILRTHISEQSTLLELGMGPGKDLTLLTKYYIVTGSDNSPIFLERYRRTHKNADLLLLNAITLDTTKQFDAIYSNKVHHHLTTKKLQTSFTKQKAILGSNGILFHSFWKGSKVENIQGLLFTYYQIEDLKKIVENEFEIIEIATYTEIDKDDSIYVILRKKCDPK